MRYCDVMAGHVRKRPSGSWQAIASFRDETGKLVQITKTVPSKKEADDALPDLLKLARQKSKPAIPMTVEELLNLWWEVHAPKLAESTRKVNRYQIDKWLIPKLGHYKLRVLTAYHIDKAFNEMGELGGDARKLIYNQLRAALNQAVKWKWMPDNPALDAEVPKVARRRIPRVTPEKFQELLVAADRESEMFGLFLRTALVVSGRRGEVTTLRWDEFDAEAMMLRVNGTKTEYSERPVFIGPHLTRRLVLYKAAVELAGIDVVGPIKPGDYIFTLDPFRRTPLNNATASRIYKRVRDSLEGFDGVRLHDVRKLAATWLNHEGISVPTISHRLGHSRNSTTHTTLDIYTGRVASEDREAGTFLDRVVAGANETTEADKLEG